MQRINFRNASYCTLPNSIILFFSNTKDENVCSKLLLSMVVGLIHRALIAKRYCTHTTTYLEFFFKLNIIHNLTAFLLFITTLRCVIF